MQSDVKQLSAVWEACKLLVSREFARLVQQQSDAVAALQWFNAEITKLEYALGQLDDPTYSDESCYQERLGDTLDIVREVIRLWREGEARGCAN